MIGCANGYVHDRSGSWCAIESDDAEMLDADAALQPRSSWPWLGLVLQSTEAGAQERARIEIVPQIAHAGDVDVGRVLAQTAHMC